MSLNFYFSAVKSFSYNLKAFWNILQNFILSHSLITHWKHLQQSLTKISVLTVNGMSSFNFQIVIIITDCLVFNKWALLTGYRWSINYTILSRTGKLLILHIVLKSDTTTIWSFNITTGHLITWNWFLLQYVSQQILQSNLLF